MRTLRIRENLGVFIVKKWRYSAKHQGRSPQIWAGMEPIWTNTYHQQSRQIEASVSMSRRSSSVFWAELDSVTLKSGLFRVRIIFKNIFQVFSTSSQVVSDSYSEVIRVSSCAQWTKRTQWNPGPGRWLVHPHNLHLYDCTMSCKITRFKKKLSKPKKSLGHNFDKLTHVYRDVS